MGPNGFHHAAYLPHVYAAEARFGFPLNQRAQDLMMGAPSAVSARQLRDVHIGLVRKL